MREVALLDYDGTLHPGDSIVSYLHLAVRMGIAPKRQWARAAKAYIHQRRHPEHTAQAKALTLSFLTGHTPAELEELNRAFWQQQAAALCPDARRELERLRGEGVECWLVSASPSVYMGMAPEYVPVDGVLSTPCVLEDGRYTGRVGANCKGEEKASRAREAFGDAVIRYAYGDSASDAPMLRLAETPVLVNASQKLRGMFPGAACLRWGRG